MYIYPIYIHINIWISFRSSNLKPSTLNGPGLRPARFLGTPPRVVGWPCWGLLQLFLLQHPKPTSSRRRRRREREEEEEGEQKQMLLLCL